MIVLPAHMVTIHLTLNKQTNKQTKNFNCVFVGGPITYSRMTWDCCFFCAHTRTLLNSFDYNNVLNHNPVQACHYYATRKTFVAKHPGTFLPLPPLINAQSGFLSDLLVHYYVCWFGTFVLLFNVNDEISKEVLL